MKLKKILFVLNPFATARQYATLLVEDEQDKIEPVRRALLHQQKIAHLRNVLLKASEQYSNQRIQGYSP